MKLIVVKNNKEVEQYYDLIHEFDKNKVDYFILSLKAASVDSSLKVKSESDYFENLNTNIFVEAIKLYRLWGENKVNTIKIRDYLVIDDIDLWEFMEANFISLLYEHFNNRLQMIKLFKKVFDSDKVDFVYYVDDGSPVSRAIDDVSRHFKAKCIKIKSRKFTINDIAAKYLRKYNRIKREKSMEYSKNQVVFIMNLNSGLLSIEPILKMYDDKIILRQEIRAKEYLDKILNRANLKYIDFESFANKEIRIKVKNIVNEYKKKYKKIKKVNFQYLDISLDSTLKDIFEYFFEKRLFVEEIIYVNEVGKSMIDNAKPSLVFGLDESSGLAKPIYKYCKKVGVPVLYLQHGVLSDREPTCYEYSYIDEFLVYGLKSKKFFVDRGIKNITVTGWPKLDEAVKERNSDEIRRKLHISNKKIILFTSAVARQINLPIFSSLLESLHDLDEFQIIVKRHPGDEITSDEYYSYGKGTNIEVKILDFDLYDLFYISDVVISFNSSTALEALVFNKPVISLNLTGAKEDFPYVGSGACYGINKKEDLNKAIKNIISNGDLRKSLKSASEKLIQDLFYKIDGKSTERVIEVIERYKPKRN